MIRGLWGAMLLNLFSNFKWVMKWHCCLIELACEIIRILSGPFLVSRTGDAG